MTLRKFALGGLVIVAVALVSTVGLAGEPLHVRIDRLIAAGAGDVPLQPASTGAEFVRRAYLDLAGRIPTVAETRSFLNDASPEKRTALIDKLLGGSEYPRRMQELFHVMLMERRGNNKEWTRFLRSAFEQNMPWDELVQNIIRPDVKDEDLRGAGYFYTARLVSEGAMAPIDVPGLTRDVGRLFAGIDLQCAQCHDHISIDQYKQRDFQGLHVIFENLQKRRDVSFPAVAEKLMTDRKEFMSVFIQIPQKVGPVVPGGSEVEIVRFEKGKEFALPPNRKKRFPGVPRFSPLQILADNLAAADNDLFCRNIANRLWFVMMGRGLVEPLDLQHNANPATHPKLLKLLASEFAAHKFDIKWMIRELALSRTYQRTSLLPSPDAKIPPEFYAVAIEKRLSAEQLFWSTLIASGEAARPREQQAEDDGQQAEEDGQKPAADIRRTDLEILVDGSEELTKLKQKFVDKFSNPPKEPEVEFAPTVKAALFLMHDDDVLQLLQPRPGNLVDRLSRLEDVNQIADELFLTTLNRLPTEEDRADVVEFLSRHDDSRADAIGQLAWALLTSTEFVVNH